MMAEKNMVEAVRDAMFEEMKRDPRIIVMGEDVEEGASSARRRGSSMGLRTLGA
jgi:pyruvate/2-oxoglutarate/acetoin dehydrogenase E1 component